MILVNSATVAVQTYNIKLLIAVLNSINSYHGNFLQLQCHCADMIQCDGVY